MLYYKNKRNKLNQSIDSYVVCVNAIYEDVYMYMKTTFPIYENDDVYTKTNLKSYGYKPHR